jgi:hypothetical protein
MRDLLADLEVGEEVVEDGLDENTSPVDRVDCAEMVFLILGPVHEQRLHNVLKRKREDWIQVVLP